MTRDELINEMSLMVNMLHRDGFGQYAICSQLADLCEQYFNQWNERSKANPKTRGSYLTYREGIDDISINSFGTSKGWENGRNKGADNIYRITHWMPLPKPPKGG